MPLTPARTKYRKTQKGSLAGNAKGGNYIAFGDFGIQVRAQLLLYAYVDLHVMLAHRSRRTCDLHATRNDGHAQVLKVGQFEVREHAPLRREALAEAPGTSRKLSRNRVRYVDDG